MKPHSMEEKISYRLFLMGFLGLLFTAALCIFVFHRAFTAQAWDDLEKESDLIRAGYDLTSEPQQLSFFVTGDLRITLISPDGDVIFESATDQPMENHLTRPEIVQALQGSIGKDIRDSQTMGYETYYYAVQLPGGNILRVAQDAETVWSVYDGALPAIVLSCVALMLAAAILSTLLTRALVQPVLNMTEDLDHIQDKVPYKELIPFAESIHADRILRENNEKMRQDFTANVSHELKTPLTSISGYAELIETGIAKPEDVSGFAQKIHGEASRMIQLVNDILQLSSLDNASETSSMPEMEVVDLLDVVKECVERQKLNARHAYITLTYLGESAPVRGNRNLLDELCQNLCDNSIRYNRPGASTEWTRAAARPPAAPVWGWPSSSTLPSSTGPASSWKVRWTSARPSRSPSPRHPDFSSTQKYNVCLQLRAGVFCWVKPVGRACAQQTVLLQMQQVCPLLPAGTYHPKAKLFQLLTLCRIRLRRAVGRLAVQTQGGRLLPESN